MIFVPPPPLQSNLVESQQSISTDDLDLDLVTSEQPPSLKQPLKSQGADFGPSQTGFVDINITHPDLMLQSNVPILNDGVILPIDTVDLGQDGIDEIITLVEHIETSNQTGFSLVIVNGSTLELFFNITEFIGPGYGYRWLSSGMRWANFSVGQNPDLIFYFDKLDGSESSIFIVSLNTFESFLYLYPNSISEEFVYDQNGDGFDEQFHYRTNGQFDVVNLKETLEQQTLIVNSGSLLMDDTLPNLLQFVVVANLTGDGISDYIYVWYSHLGIEILERNVVWVNGADHQILNNYTIGAETPVYGFSEDLDQNGRDELVTLSFETGQVVSYDLNGTIHYNKSDASIPGTFYQLPDVNGDNVSEFMIYTLSKLLILLDGKTGSEIFATNIITEFVQGYSFTDYNYDGEQEFIISDANGQYHIIALNGTALLTWNYDREVIGSEILTFDQNGDGKDDFLHRFLLVTDGLVVYLADTFGPGIGKVFYNPQSINPGNIVDIEVEITDVWAVRDPKIFFTQDEGNSYIRYELEFDPESSLYVTQISVLQDAPLKFYIEVRDNFQNIRLADNGTNLYEIPINSKVIFSVLENEILSDTKIGTINLDTVPDLIALQASEQPIFHFINGQSGQIENSLTMNTHIINFLLNDINQDGISDIIYLEHSKTVAIDGTTNAVLWDVDLEFGLLADEIYLADLNDDNILDVVVRYDRVLDVSDPILILINGQSGAIMNRIINSIVGLTGVDMLAVEDVTQDGVDDLIVFGFGTFFELYVLDGANGEINWYLEGVTISPFNEEFTLFDLNNDGIRELVVYYIIDADEINGSLGDNVIIIDLGNKEIIKKIDDLQLISITFSTYVYQNQGTNRIYMVFTTIDGNIILYDYTNDIITKQIDIDIRPVDLIISDFNGDGFKDIAIAGSGRNFLKIDGLDFKVDIFYVSPNPLDASLFTADFNGDQISDIGTSSAGIIVFRDLKPFESIFIKNTIVTDLLQGLTIDLTVNLEDILNNSINNANVGFIVVQKNRTIFYSAPEIADGTYGVVVTTGDWLAGDWAVVAIVNHNLYNNIEFGDYGISVNDFGRTPITNITITGEFIVQISTDGEINENVIVQGNSFSLSAQITDKFSNYYDQISVVVSNAKNQFITVKTNNLFVTEIETSEFEIGENILQIIISDDNFETMVVTFKFEVEPKFPNVSSSDPLFKIIIVFGFIFILSISILMAVLFRITSTKNSDKNVKRMSYFAQLILIGTSIATYLRAIKKSNDNNYNEALFFVFLTIGLIIIGFEMWLFIKSYHFQKNGKIRHRFLLGDLFFVLSTYVMLFEVFRMGSNMEWFNFYVRSEIWTFYSLSLPRLVWEVGGLSFFSGFVWTLLTINLGIRSNIKDLKEATHTWISDGVITTDIEIRQQKERMAQLREQLKDYNTTFGFWYITIVYTILSALRLLEFSSVLLIGVFGVFFVIFLGLITVFRPSLFKLFSGVKRTKKKSLDLI